MSKNEKFQPATLENSERAERKRILEIRIRVIQDLMGTVRRTDDVGSLTVIELQKVVSGRIVRFENKISKAGDKQKDASYRKQLGVLWEQWHILDDILRKELSVQEILTEYETELAKLEKRA